MARKVLLAGTGAALLSAVALFAWGSAEPLAPSGPTAAAPAGEAPSSPPAQAAPPGPPPLPATQQEAAARRRHIDVLAQGRGGLERLQAAWAQTEDGAAREQALIAASRLGSAEAARWLAELAATDTRLGGRAGAALGAVRSAAAAPELVRLAESDGPVLVRANAVRALAASGTQRHARTLTALVVDPHEAQRVRQEAALALARLGDADAVEPLGRTLAELAGQEGPEAEQLRISLVQGLAGIGTPQARRVLEQHRARPLSRLEATFVERALARR